MRKIENFVDGEFISVSNETLEVYDPQGEICAKVVNSSEDLSSAIKSSEEAFNEWSKVTPLKRSRVLSKYKELIEKDINSLAKLVSEEHGKTLGDAKALL